MKYTLSLLLGGALFLGVLPSTSKAAVVVSVGGGPDVVVAHHGYHHGYHRHGHRVFYPARVVWRHGHRVVYPAHTVWVEGY